MPQGFWHLTLCTLLSSQGSDTPTSTLRLQLRGNFSTLPEWRSKSNRLSRKDA